MSPTLEKEALGIAMIEFARLVVVDPPIVVCRPPPTLSRLVCSMVASKFLALTLKFSSTAREEWNQDLLALYGAS